MIDLTKIYDRSDAEKWAHPEIEEFYRMGEAPSNTFEMFDPDVPFAERKKAVKELEATFKEAYPVVEDDFTKVYEYEGCPEEPDARSRAIVTFPRNTKKKKKPCIITIPCGGLAVCWDFFNFNEELAERHKAVVLSIHYRTAFDDNGKFPAALNDCHAAFKFVIDHAEELGVDPEKIVFYGFSTGGHLGLALPHRLKRYGYHGHMPRGIVTWVPVADERLIYESSTIQTPAWGGEQVFYYAFGWLGLHDFASTYVGPEAFANHAEAEDCVGLPPTFIHTAENDPCMGACMDYISKLHAAGVFINLDIWGGSNHAAMDVAQGQPGFDEGGKYANRWWDMVNAQISDCFKYDLRRQWVAGEVGAADPVSEPAE